MRIEREFGAGDVVMVSRSALLEGVVAELLDYFGDPRGYGSKLRKSEACSIASGIVQRAFAGSSSPEPSTSL